MFTNVELKKVPLQYLPINRCENRRTAGQIERHACVGYIPHTRDVYGQRVILPDLRNDHAIKRITSSSFDITVIVLVSIFYPLKGQGSSNRGWDPGSTVKN